MLTYVCVCVCDTDMCMWVLESHEGIGSLGAGVTLGLQAVVSLSVSVLGTKLLASARAMPAPDPN